MNFVLRKILAGLSTQQNRTPWLGPLILGANERAVRVVWALQGVRPPELDCEAVAGPRRYRFAMLGIDDAPEVIRFLSESITSDEQAFIPHPCTPRGVRRVLGFRAVHSVGAFHGEELVAYACLRPTVMGRTLMAAVIARRHRRFDMPSHFGRCLLEVIHATRQTLLTTIAESNKASLAAARRIGIHLEPLSPGIVLGTTKG